MLTEWGGGKALNCVEKMILSVYISHLHSFLSAGPAEWAHSPCEHGSRSRGHAGPQQLDLSLTRAHLTTAHDEYQICQQEVPTLRAYSR